MEGVGFEVAAGFEGVEREEAVRGFVGFAAMADEGEEVAVG